MYNLAVLGVTRGPETKYVANFSHRHVNSACFLYQMSVRAIDPAKSPSGDFADEGGAVPFRDAMCHKYSINKLQRHFILSRIERRTRW